MDWRQLLKEAIPTALWSTGVTLPLWLSGNELFRSICTGRASWLISVMLLWGWTFACVVLMNESRRSK